VALSLITCAVDAAWDPYAYVRHTEHLTIG
jgi:hypothetical protein